MISLIWQRWVICCLARRMLCGFVMVLCAAAWAVEGQERVTTDLGLNDLIRQVLERNEGIQQRILEIEIARKKYNAEKGAFEPDLVASYDRVENLRETSAQEARTLGQIFKERNNVYNAGLEGLVPTGARIRLGYTLRADANNVNRNSFGGNLDYLTNEFISFIGVSATQPLLKNFGLTATLANLRLAALASDIAYQEYRRQLMILISTAEATYWNLYMAQEQMLFFKDSVGVAETLVRDNKAKAQAGKGSELEVLEAEAGLALRKSKQSDAREKYFEAINRLNSLYAQPMMSNIVVAVDRPAVMDVPISYFDSYIAATELNPDYLSQMKKIASENVRLAYAKNQRLPQLDIKASYGLNGLGETHEAALKDIESHDFPSFTAGVELRIPITGGIRGRNELDAAKLRQKQALVALKEIETQIGTSLDTSMRKIRASQESVRNYETVVNYNKNLLDTQLARLDVGKVESRKVLEVEADLFEARNSLVDAQVQYRRALLELELLEGTLLKSRNLDLTKPELESKTALLLRKGNISEEQYVNFMKELQWQFQQKASLDPSTESRARQLLRQSESAAPAQYLR